MTMLDEVDVRKAMRARLKTVSTLPSSKTRIAYENRTFNPPTLPEGTSTKPLWIKEQQTVLSEDHAATGTLEIIGETLWMINTPAGRGVKESDELAKAIAEAFEPTQSLVGSAETIILERCERRPYRTNPEYPAWTFKTVAVRWRAFTSTS